MTTNIPTEDNELTMTMLGRLIAEIMKFHGESKEDASRLATILLPHIDQYSNEYVASEVVKAELAMLDRLTEPHRDTMHDTYDYDGIAESVLDKLNTLKGKK